MDRDAAPSSSHAPNGRPLSYTPYQSHRRTSSLYSNQSATNSNSSIPNGTLAHTKPVVAGPSSPSPAAAPSSPLVPVVRPRPKAPQPSQPSSDSNDLPAPPPLRRLKPAGGLDTGGSAGPSTGPSTLSRHPSEASTSTHTLPGLPSSTSSPQLSSSPGTPPPPSAGGHDGRSPSPRVSSTNSRSNMQRANANRSGTPTAIPAHLDVNIAPSKQISTSQALRMRELQNQQQNARSQDSGTGSSGSPRSSPRSQSPSGGSARRPSAIDFESSLALQTAATSASMSLEYGSTYQPRGVVRSQMAELIDVKSIKRRQAGKAQVPEGGQQFGGKSSLDDKSDAERNQERIRRRVEKLLAIHYPSSTSKAGPSPTPPASRSASLLSTLAPHSRFLSTLQHSSSIRALEQSLVPWQPDDSVSNCPICTRPFGGMVGRRKHHCRACGRVVCASPEMANGDTGPNSSSNAATSDGESVSGARGKCSGIVVRDESVAPSVGGMSEPDSTGLAIKDQPLENSLEAMLLQDNGQQGVPKDPLESQGFRLCRSCREIVLRGQYMDEESTLPPYVRLYDQLMTLQRDIETSLPEFQELIMGIQKSDPGSTLGPTATIDGANDPSSQASKSVLLQLQRDAASARKQLLANFANYDSLAKSLRNLPDGGNVSLRRLKEAIWVRAGIFLQANVSMKKPKSCMERNQLTL